MPARGFFGRFWRGLFGGAPPALPFDPDPGAVFAVARHLAAGRPRDASVGSGNSDLRSYAGSAGRPMSRRLSGGTERDFQWNLGQVTIEMKDTHT